MKKVGIITIHKSPNYGASLQAYALYKYIESVGDDCEIINLSRPAFPEYIYEYKFRPYRNNLFSLRNRFRKFKNKLLRRNYSTPLYSSLASQKRFDQFNNQLKYSRLYRKVSELYENTPIYDVYITGSDQLWNPEQPYCLEPYFLTFAPQRAIKISYATSIAIQNLSEKEKKDFKKWLSSYTAVSVREKQGKQLLDTFVSRKVCTVADPTFLLDREHWHGIAVRPANKKKYILLFTIAYYPDLIDYAFKLSKESGLHLILFKSPYSGEKEGDYEVVNDYGPKEFLGYIANAEMVITDSFHGTVFSILMRAKNFFSYIAPGNTKSSRITDLLETFDLSDHILDSSFNILYSQLENIKINDSCVLEKIDMIKENSRDFLNKYI